MAPVIVQRTPQLEAAVIKRPGTRIQDYALSFVDFVPIPVDSGAH